MSNKQEFLIRVYIVLGMFVLCTLALFYKAFVISVVEGDAWREKGKDLYYDLQPVEAERGKILSSDGSPLATSLPFFEIRMDTKAEGLTKNVFMNHVDALAQKLSDSNVITQNKQIIKNWLIRERQKGNRYLAIAKELNYQQLEEIKKFPMFNLGQNKGGCIVIQKNRREKPYKILASRTIGINRNNAQSIGLEASFDVDLKGQEGKRMMRKVGPDIYLPMDDVAELAAKKGCDITTTINISIQEIAEKSLEEAIQKHDAEEGCAIVMEVATGAILAIANLSYNDEGNLDEEYNFAIGKSTEPGSTMKLASVMAMLEEGKVDLNTAVNLNGGSCVFYDRVMKDSKLHGITMVDLQHAFVQSSNVGISRLANSVFNDGAGQKKFVQYLQNFALDKKTSIELEGEPNPTIKDPEKNKNIWYGTTLPWMSVGYEIQLTPLQMLNLYNSVANNGKVMKPYLVSKITEGQKIIRQIEPIVLKDSIISTNTLEKVKFLLESVVEDGTAKIIKSDAYKIAGKTGTAVSNYYKDGEERNYQASFAGYFPADAPKFSCIVFIYNPKQAGYYGAEVAAPVFKKIADRCMRTSFMAMNTVNNVPKARLASEFLPVGNRGYSRDFETVFNHIGLPFYNKDSQPWIMTTHGDKGIYTSPLEVNTRLVPDVMGMGLRDAIFVLDLLKIKVLPRGSGKVVLSEYSSGSELQDDGVGIK